METGRTICKDGGEVQGICRITRIACERVISFKKISIIIVLTITMMHCTAHKFVIPTYFQMVIDQTVRKAISIIAHRLGVGDWIDWIMDARE